MKPRKIQVTPKQLDRLLEAVRTLPEAPVGEHLSDDQFILYSMSTLSPEATSIVDQHLASCSDCATEMQRLLEASESWNAGTDEMARRTVTQFSNDAKPKTKVLHRLEASLQSLFAVTNDEYTVAWAAEANRQTARRVWSYKDEESRIEGQGFIDSNGDLIFVFSSKQMELKDQRLRLQLDFEEGGVSQEGVLEANESETEVGATFVIPNYQLPEKEPQVSFSLEETEQ